MGGQAPVAQVRQEPQGREWSFARRLAFQFCFVYLGLYCLGTQIFGGLFLIPKVEVTDPARLWPMRQIIFWTAAHIFHATLPLVYAGSGSGDKTFDWVFAFCLLVIAALATGIWSVLDRKRKTTLRCINGFGL
jgi:hypothetical protein